jgi:hypothetical protein
MRIFNCTQDYLAPHERFRLVHGTLYVEDAAVRKKVCWLRRLFTRNQYDDGKILNHFVNYQWRVGGNLARQTYYIANLNELIERVRVQNQKYRFSSPFCLWLKGKKIVYLFSAEAVRDRLVRLVEQPRHRRRHRFRPHRPAPRPVPMPVARPVLPPEPLVPPPPPDNPNGVLTQLSDAWQSLISNFSKKPQAAAPQTDPNKLQEYLEVMREAQSIARRVGFHTHAKILHSVITLEEKQQEVLAWLAEEPIETVRMQRDGKMELVKRYRNWRHLNHYLLSFTQCTSGSLRFHTELQTCDYAIRTFPEAYAKAYQLAKTNKIVREFFTKVLEGRNACFEGNFSELIAWQMAHPDPGAATANQEAESLLAPEYDPKAADMYMTLGAFYNYYREKSFRAFFKETVKRPFNKNNALDEHLWNSFLDGDNVGKKPDLTRDTNLEKSFADKKGVLSTKEHFLEFLKTEVRNLPGQEIPWKAGALKEPDLKAAVDAFWAAVM